jgi:HSP20 family protein
MYMGISQFMAKEIMKELSNKSREFYEFVLPPVDIVEGANDLIAWLCKKGY